MGFEYQPDQFPAVFWDLFGEQGHPIRATVSEMGPLLLSRLLDLNDVQEGVLNIAFRIADDEGLPLLDLKDLRAILDAIAPLDTKSKTNGTGSALLDKVKQVTAQYGNVTKQIGRHHPAPAAGAGEPGRREVLRRARARPEGLHAHRPRRPRLCQYPRRRQADGESAALRDVPAVAAVGAVRGIARGRRSADKPKLVFFFDEAHLLFTDAPKALLDKIEQVVRLVRSKGVGVYFVTQNPLDVPDKVLAQLGNRVQHALRAFTPRDQKAVQAAAETFRPNPKLDTAKVIMELGKGEALVSFLEGNGTPSMVERCMIRPPCGRIGPVTAEERKAIIAQSPVKGKYDETRRSRIRLRGAATSASPTEAAPAGLGAGCPGSGIRWRRHRRLARQHFRHQPAARRAADHDPDHRARSDAHRDDAGRRAGRRGTRQVDRRRQDRQHRSAARSCAAHWAASCAADRNPKSRGTMNASAALPKVLDRIDAELDQSLERLFDFLRIQSISTDPAYATHCKAAAEFVAEDLDEPRLRRQVRPTGGHPVVVGKSGNGNGRRRACLFYGHYDVQPVDPLDLWETPPFEPRIDDTARRPQDHRRARRLRRQRPGDDLRRGAAAPSRR